MSWRRLIPLVLVGLLGVSVAAAAAVGAAQSLSSPGVLSPEAQSKLFHRDVTRTLASRSFTVHFAGQATVYEAPNRTELVETPPGSFGLSPNLVTVGSSSYVHFSGEWSKFPFTFPGLGNSSEVLSYLRALSSFKTAKLSGDTYTVRGVLSELPKALVTVMFTVVTHGPNNQTGASFSPPRPNEQAKVIGRVVVDDGRVTSETFTALGAYPSQERDGRPPTGTVTYTRFNSSPAIAVPTEADLRPPCDATASGSCQVTTKGVAPRSPMCRALRAQGDNSLAQAIAKVHAATESRQWRAIRTSELGLLKLESSFAQAFELSQQTAPSAIQRVEGDEITYLHEEKLDLLKSRTSSQFKALNSSIVPKTSAAFLLLGQYEGEECGSTTTYYSEGQGQLSLGQVIAGSH